MPEGPVLPATGPLADLLDRLVPRCTFPPVAEGPRVCAVSGGADSLALLVLARHAGLDVEAVHVDHGLRAESADEVAVVARSVDRIGAPFRSIRVRVDPGGDLEARARVARRSVLPPDAMTGHTADDQAETVFVNLLRGAGVRGLAAMRSGPTHPLLAIRRSETREVCRLAALEVIEDPSNADPRFVRNRIRHELLPLAADIGGRDPVPLLARTAAHARDAEDLIADRVGDLEPTDVGALRREPSAVRGAALRQWLTDAEGRPPSTADLDRVLAVVDGRHRSCQIAGGRTIRRSQGVLRVEPTGPPR